jgi:hypothetical protein
LTKLLTPRISQLGRRLPNGRWPKDRKTYAYLFFLIEPNYWAPIIDIKSDKLLIGLHQSWAPVRTALTLRDKIEKPEIELITSALKQFEANESLVAAPGPQGWIEGMQGSREEFRGV